VGVETRALEGRFGPGGRDRRLGQTKTKTVLILGTVLSLLIAATAAWSIQRRSFERGLAEEALRDSEERYRMLLSEVPDRAIVLLDPRGQIVSWNAMPNQSKVTEPKKLSVTTFPASFLRKISSVAGRRRYSG